MTNDINAQRREKVEAIARKAMILSKDAGHVRMSHIAQAADGCLRDWAPLPQPAELTPSVRHDLTAKAMMYDEYLQVYAERPVNDPEVRSARDSLDCINAILNGASVAGPGFELSEEERDMAMRRLEHAVVMPDDDILHDLLVRLLDHSNETKGQDDATDQSDKGEG